jgi:peptidoglycan hydrolase-like protein with peptidoglycan-binding domain
MTSQPFVSPTAAPGSRARRPPGLRTARNLALAATAGLALAVTGLMPAAVAVPTVPTMVKTPAVPASLPAGIETMSPYVPQTSCEWTDKPGSIALGDLLKATYPDTSYGISRPCTGTMESEHYDGRAVDWMNSIRKPAQAAQATAVLKWLFATDAAGNTYANVRRLGVMYVIWNGQIWGSYNAVWKPYLTCAAHPETSWDTTCHRDHMHFSLSWAGAEKRTSFWSGAVAANDYGPCRQPDLEYAAPYTRPNPTTCASYPVITAPAGSSAAYASLVKFSGAELRAGYSGNPVTALQNALGVSPATGTFGPKTTAAVLAFKGAHRLPDTALVDATTWRALLAAYKTAPSVTPTPAPATDPTVDAPAPHATPTAKSPVSTKPVVTKKPVAKPVAKPAATNPLTRYRGMVLRVGSKGAAVTALQKRLKLATVTGTFASKTQTAVKTFQRTHHLPVTGVVNRATWIALGA